MRIKNLSYKSQIFDLKSMSYVNLFETGVSKSEFNTASLEAHTNNCLRMSQRPDTYIPVLKHLQTIPPRTAWEINFEKFRQLGKFTFNTNHPKSLKNIQDISCRLTNLVGKNLAVELSGGLDTAIIIGVLRSIGLNPTLVGMLSERYEFRTERYIQEKIASASDNVHFIEEEKALPFAKLKETPVHPIPNKASLFYYLNEVKANWAVQNSYKYLVNGIGFDTILIDQIANTSEAYFFDPINLDDVWANDFVYNSKGINYVNVASIYCVLKAVITLRRGQPEDTKKLWARAMFSQMIPPELSRFRYKASFGAVYDQGLEQAKSEILEICEVACELTQIHEIRPSVMKVLINGVRSYDFRSEFEFLARLSYANWIYQLDRSKLIVL